MFFSRIHSHPSQGKSLEGLRGWGGLKCQYTRERGGGQGQTKTPLVGVRLLFGVVQGGEKRFTEPL